MTKLFNETERITTAKAELGSLVFGTLLARMPCKPCDFHAGDQLALVRHGYSSYPNLGDRSPSWTPKAHLLFRDIDEAKEPRWRTKEGQLLKLEEMGDSHLINSLLMAAKCTTKATSAPGTSAYWVHKLAREVSRRGLRLDPEGRLLSNSKIAPIQPSARSVFDQLDQLAALAGPFQPKDAPAQPQVPPDAKPGRYTHYLEPLTLRPGEVVMLVTPGSTDLEEVLGNGAAVRAHFTVDNTVFIEAVCRNGDGTLMRLSPSVLMMSEMLKHLELHQHRAEDGRHVVGVTKWFRFSIDPAAPQVDAAEEARR